MTREVRPLRWFAVPSFAAGESERMQTIIAFLETSGAERTATTDNESIIRRKAVMFDW